jgi:hypothetical protein
VEGELTEDEVEKLKVGDRIRARALTGTIVEAGPDFVAIQWDEKPLPELYTRESMSKATLYSSGG